jgi:uncharacterized protein YjbI with pentapeptide repeats
MRFFFRRSNSSAGSASGNSAGITTLELAPPNEEAPAEKLPSVAEEPESLAPAAQPAEVSSKKNSFAPEKQLVPASELPSAAAALAEIFDEASAPPPIEPRRHNEAKPVAPAKEPVIELAIADQDQPLELIIEQAKDASLAATEASYEAPPAQPVQSAAPAVDAKAPEPILAPKSESSAATETGPQIEEPPQETQPEEAKVSTQIQASAPAHSSAELCPEDAATVLAAASGEITGDANQAQPPAADKSGASAEKASLLGLSDERPIAASDWAFEETLAAHREWIETKGVRGKKADLANAELAGVELINVNLRLADLHYADLKSADLLLADLRDTCMVRADLEEACLVGANLEGANLEGASLETALGLVPRQLAGANLREASLPAQIAQFPAASVFRTAARTAVQFFAAIMVLSGLSVLAIWKTKDIQLVTDSAILPFLHSARAAAFMPAAQIFLIAPVVIFLLYLAFLHQIQRAWGAALELPAIFPDGRSLGEKESGIILGLLRAQFRWMNQDPPSARILETTLSLLLAYWTVPMVLFLYWARYLTLQEIHGTILQELLACVAAGIALHATFKVGRPQEKWALQQTFAGRIAESLRQSRPPVLVGILLAVATFISFGTIAGVPHDLSRAPQYGPANIRRWAPTALWAFGYDPYADLTEAHISAPPANWNWSDNSVSAVRGAHLDEPRFRYAQAYGAFFANAHLWHADFRGAYLSNADFRAADLTQSNFQYAIMDSARMNHANLDRSVLQDGHFARADFRNANLSYASLADTFLMDAHFDDASLYDAFLSHATMVRTSFERADLRNSHIDSSNLEHADLRSAYLWSANVQNSDLKDADFGSAILIGASLRGSDLSGAHFSQTVLGETNLTDAILDGADMRGAFGLTAYQVCQAHSHAGTLFDDSLQPQINAECPSSR